MLKQLSRAWQPVTDLTRSRDRQHLVLAAGGVLVILQLLFRAWMLYPSWFFLDDYNLLHDAREGPGLAHLFTPYNGHLMPAGRLAVWLVAQSGSLNWGAAATLTLLMQALASAAALWMLITLFGRQPAVLAPLVIYLTSAVTVPALVWWAAALNLVPVQAAFFVAVGCGVRHLRGEGRLWLAATMAAVAGGLLFDVKGVLVLPVLVAVAVAYFARGGVWARFRSLVLDHRAAVVTVAVVLVGYSAYYLAAVPQIATNTDLSTVPEVTDAMLGTAFPAGILGGPWRWSLIAPPTAYADPPGVLVHLAWVVMALVVLHSALRRRRALRAWALLAGYLLVLLVLLVVSRGPTFGAVIGLEYRYLTDAVGVVTLCLGLAYLPVLGAVEASAPREPPLLAVRVPAAVVVILLLVVAASGVASSSAYAGYLHHDNASNAYLHHLRDDLRAEGRADLAETVVPDSVFSQLAAPVNTTRQLAPLVSDRVRFPAVSPRLLVVGPDGGLRTAAIQLGVASEPGPTERCGWRVTSDGTRIPMQGRAFRWVWWLRIGYLASHDSPMTVRAGGSVVHTTVESGVHSLYVRVEGSFSTVRLDGLEDGVTVCVDTVEAGQPVPGGVPS